jgi:O-methyltransferase involved in polyketide biosynthesis
MERAPGPTGRAPRPASQADTSLPALRAEFPQFRIWQETIGDRTRYIARRLDPGSGTHTVVTPDPGELRTALSGDPAARRPAAGGLPFDVTVPSIARVYDRWLGGKDNLAADRAAADALTAEYPEIPQVARANRQFVLRAVRYTAAQSITQYIDIGAGLPASPSVDQVARNAHPDARVAYVDNDPVVLTHARALLAGPGVVIVPEDMRQPDAILDNPELRTLIDLRQPVAILLASVLHFVTAGEADTIVAAFTAAMAPGSYLIVSAGTTTGTDPALIARMAAAYQGTTEVTGRTETEIAAYFSGLELIPPGLVDVWAWRPDSQWYWPPPPSARILGAVARKPARRRGQHGSARLLRD